MSLKTREYQMGWRQQNKIIYVIFIIRHVPGCFSPSISVSCFVWHIKPFFLGHIIKQLHMEFGFHCLSTINESSRKPQKKKKTLGSWIFKASAPIIFNILNPFWNLIGSFSRMHGYSKWCHLLGKLLWSIH
jgi:hypothetical protein